MKKIILAVLFFMATSSNAFAGSDLKIGFVSVQKLLAEAPQVEAVSVAMTERFGGKQEELKALELKIKEMQENYKRNELVMTEDKLNELKTQLIGKLQQFKKQEATLAQEVNTMRSQELAVLKKTISTIVDELAKKGEYDLILSEGVVFASEKIDITEAVLAEMKKTFKK